MSRKLKFDRPLSVITFMLVLTGLAACTSAPPVKPHHNPHSHAEPRSPSRGALAVATNMIGTPYHYGGASPRGFDCSGLVQYAYSQVGVQAPRSTKEQYRQIRRIRVSELQPGDLVFFKLSGNRVSHVGIYAGDDRFIHSPSSGKSVSYASLRNPYWKKRIAGAGRLP